jgi:hypothetical protein
MSDNFPPPPHLTDTYYAYYDKNTKQLLSITNEKSNLYQDFLEVDYDTYSKLVSGKEKFSDYLLGHVVTDEKTVLKLMTTVEHSYNFKNVMLDIITENKIKNPELIVEWSASKKSWNFIITAESRARLSSKVDSSKILFFIILESDYDFLVRTIDVDTMKLFSNLNVSIPFQTNLENKIDKISVATGLIFESTQLRIINDNN